MRNYFKLTRSKPEEAELKLKSNASGKYFTLLSTSFPPKGGSGVQRPYFQSKFLSLLGWNVKVVTITSSPGDISDSSFISASNYGVQVIKIHPGIVKSRLNWIETVDRRLRRIFFFPDEFKIWTLRAARETLKNIAPRHVVMGSIGSPSVLLALHAVKHASFDNKILTVVDFRDFWALNQRIDVPKDRRSDVNNSERKRLEQDVLRTVDGVVVVSEAYKRRLMIAYPWLLDKQVLVIENGYVESDFKNAEQSVANFERNENFTIRYTGYLLKDHDPDLFFLGLSIIKKRNPSLYRIMRFEYFGGGAEFAAELAVIYGVSDICTFNGYVPHLKAIELMLTADALYLPFAKGEGTIGGKTYEYIRSGRPLIPVLSDCDEPREILARFGITECINKNDFEAMAALLILMAEKWCAGQLNSRPPNPFLNSIERSQQARCLSQWLDNFVVEQ